MKKFITVLLMCLSIVSCKNDTIIGSENLGNHPNLHSIDTYTVYDDRTEIVYYYYHSYYNSTITPMFDVDGSPMTKEKYLKLK